MSVSLNTRQVGDVIIVNASGTVTLGPAANTFRDAIHDLAARGYKKILINLADVSYIDSWGIGEFVSCLTRVKNGGGSMKLLKPSKRVHDLLLVTKLHNVFQVFDDEVSAVSSF